MRIIVVSVVVVFLSLNSKSERLRYQALILKNNTTNVIEITTYPRLRFTGLAEKFITYHIDSITNDTTWLWQFGDMNLEIIEHRNWWQADVNYNSINKGVYLMQPNSTINLGSRVEPAKTFGNFQESDLRLDSILVGFDDKVTALTRKDIIQQATKEGKKKSSPLVLNITTVLLQ